ncbi:hypothetical protein SBA6_210028 [Candidatus Sulfopaludibacter sp. SbA6]|nr:hypothetical protein SBA6_210028 [Candidatus Sulfopaludibacter sp. SbA6]
MGGSGIGINLQVSSARDTPERFIPAHASSVGSESSFLDLGPSLGYSAGASVPSQGRVIVEGWLERILR